MFWRKKNKSPQELMAAGKYKGAIKAYKNLLKDPKKADDPTLLMQLASAYLKTGKEQEAKKLFVRVGTYYGDRGFFNKSVAVFKKALNITPDDSDILKKLAEYNDKVPRFMINEDYLKRVKAEAETHDTGEHDSFDVEEAAYDAVEQVVGTQESPVFVDPDADDVGLIEFGEDEASAEIPQKLGPDTDEVEQAQVIARARAFHDKEMAQAAETSGEEDDLVPADDVLDISAISDQEQAPTSDELVLEQSGQYEEADATTAPEAQASDEEFALNFGEAQSVSATPPAETPISKQKLDQPISRGGMVFKSQTDLKPLAADHTVTGSYNSVDDALDNIFGGPGEDGEGDLFGIDAEFGAPGRMNTGTSQRLELTLEDGTPEENNRHWPLFRTMPKEILNDFILALESRDYAPGAVIVTEGDEGDEMFLVTEGEVSVWVSIAGDPSRVAGLTEGDFFGEASLLSGAPRNATVKTDTSTSCLVLSRADFNDLIVKHPSVMASVESIYYTRLKDNASRRGEAGS